MARERCPRGANGPRDPTIASFSSTVVWFNDADRINDTMEEWMEENVAKDSGSQWQRIDLKDGTLFGKHSDGFPMLSRTAKEYVKRWRLIDFSLRKLPGWQNDDTGPANDAAGRGTEEADRVLGAVSTLVDRVIHAINGKNLGDPVDTDEELEFTNESQSSHFPTESNNNDSSEDPHDDTQTPPAKRPRQKMKTVDQLEESPYFMAKKATMSQMDQKLSGTLYAENPQPVTPTDNESSTSTSSCPSMENILSHEDEQLVAFNLSLDDVSKSNAFSNLIGRFVSFAFKRTQAPTTSFLTYDVGRVYRIVCPGNGRDSIRVEVDYFGSTTMEVVLKLSLYTPHVNEVPSEAGQWKLLKMKTE